ncbi:MAG: DUF1349 domain-containing protein [Myxococcota bacterium]
MRPPHLRDSTASPRLASIRLLIAWSAVAFSLLLPSLAPAVGFGCDPLVPVGGPLCPHDPLLPSMAEDRDLTTSFVPDLTPPVITNVVTTPGPFSATVTWTTDVPASSVASYGPSTAYENGAIQQTTLVTQHSLLLPNLLPSSTYHVEVSSVAVNGVADIGPDGTFTTTPHSGIVSDDFNLACGVLGAEWTAVDPLLDASFDVVGVGTQNAHLEIGVAAGIAHDLWVTGMDAPRLMQASADEDFEVEVKFESVPVSTVQGQGILVEESNGNFVRFDVYSTSGALRIFSASMVNFSPNIRINSAIAAPPAGEITLRVKRQGASWTYDYSYDGQNWITAAIFNHTLTVTQVGVTALNASGSPAFTAVADYFFETATRIVPEDGTVSGNPSPKLLTVNVVGGGSVTKSPDQGSYACGDQVTLTAVANVGNAFTDWSGDVTSTVNPLILTMSADRNVTATFVPDTSPPLISNVSHTTGPFSATVTWTTDVPATSVVSFGPTVAYENGTIQQTPLVTQHSVTLPSLTPSSTYHYEVSSVGGTGIAAASDIVIADETADDARRYRRTVWPRVGRLQRGVWPVGTTMDHGRSALGRQLRHLRRGHLRRPPRDRRRRRRATRHVGDGHERAAGDADIRGYRLPVRSPLRVGPSQLDPGSGNRRRGIKRKFRALRCLLELRGALHLRCQLCRLHRDHRNQFRDRGSAER